MEERLARRLSALTQALYTQEAASFSATRQSPWEGWERVLAHVPPRRVLRIADVAAGNGRFAEAAASAFPASRLVYRAIDSCRPLMGEGVELPGADIERVETDIVETLLAGKELPLEHGAYDLVGCFGFLHHLPTEEARIRLMRQLVQAVAPSGIVAVACWRFAEDPVRAEKAEASTAAACQELGIDRAELGPRDYLLGWKGRPGVWRFCHSFTAQEAASLADASGAVVVDRFLADGRTSDQNDYLVLRREA